MVIRHQVGDKVSVKNRQSRSPLEGMAKKLLLFYIGPYMINKENNKNTYKLIDPQK